LTNPTELQERQITQHQSAKDNTKCKRNWLYDVPVIMRPGQYGNVQLFEFPYVINWKGTGKRKNT
jgi:hypothetical protein